MANFSIKDLEHLSGIKAHTIRIWEQRYNIINPKRTESNIRYYDDKDLKHILNISLLNDHGYKISKIANMSHENICQAVRSITDTLCSYNDQIQKLTLSMYDLDEMQFEETITKNIQHFGFEKTIMEIVFPFLLKIGVLWQTGAINPAHEHFITSLIRQKLIVAIDGIKLEKKPYTKKFMLFLPEGELHELSLLFSHYLIKSHNHQVIYLGASLPFQDLVEAYKIHKTDYLLSIITSVPSQADVQILLNRLSTKFNDSRILVTGFQVVNQGHQVAANVKILTKFEDLLETLSEISE